MMTEETKARIREMRAGGYSYRQVADDLQMKLETIKSFCRREREKAQKANTHASDAGKSKFPGNDLCRYCGKRLVFTPGKRKKTFCNKACRSKYWTEHRDELPHNITHTFTCQCCGKEFEIYGKRNRKYCSQECYFEDRFGGQRVDEAGGSLSHHDDYCPGMAAERDYLCGRV